MSKSPSPDVQEAFLGNMVNNNVQLTVFLINGVKLQGVITGFDIHTLILSRYGNDQLVYKTAISTIMPGE